MSARKKQEPRPKAASARGLLDPGRIVEEAVAMADQTGLEALSMRRLAERLGVEAMSLYHHVPNKDSLIAAMVDLVVKEIALPALDQAWQGEMRKRARSALKVLKRHPWAAMPILSRVNTGPRMLAQKDRMYGCLLGAGFTRCGADWACHLMDSHIYGFFLQEQHFPIRPEEYASSAEAFLPMIPSERFPHLRTIAEAVITGDYDGRNSFDFGLDIILDGLARNLGGTQV